MFRNDDDKDIERVLEEQQKSFENTKMTIEENKKRVAALRESLGKTVAETREKVDGLLRQNESTVATSSQSGLFSSTANKANETVEESHKPKKGKGGCNIL